MPRALCDRPRSIRDVASRARAGENPDVRNPEEYIFVGHAEMARNIPLLFVKYQWDAEKNEPIVALSGISHMMGVGENLGTVCH